MKMQEEAKYNSATEFVRIGANLLRCEVISELKAAVYKVYFNHYDRLQFHMCNVYIKY